MSDLAARRSLAHRAEECLAIAEQVGDEELRAQYMDMAENYLKLAADEFGRDAPARERGTRPRCFFGNVCRVAVLLG